MRLTPHQKNGIIIAIMPFLKNNQADLRLYGSRTKTHLLGGDIDLLLVVKNTALTSELIENKHYLLSAIKQNIGDQKIDLIITSSEQLEADAFLKMIYPESISIQTW